MGAKCFLTHYQTSCRVANRSVVKKVRTPGVGEKMIFDENAFVEQVLPGAIVRKLAEAEMAVYRAPFSPRESRRPTWRFPNELPIERESGHSLPTGGQSDSDRFRASRLVSGT
jgi:hypothetical protein